jgi:MerR family transcriptional regulator, thiopeptide resistance regulator
MKKSRRTYQVKEAAELSGVSVRTLHHYDEIGLLVPKRRTEAGYRLYDDHDLLRLQQILIGRELGLPLEEIRRSLDDPSFDRRRALVVQRQQLQQRARQTEAMIRAIDAALAVLDGDAGGEREGTTMDMKQIFDGFDPAEYEKEAEQRWGDTDAYKESMERTKRYSADDWKRLAAEQGAVYADLAAAMKAGKQPSDDEVLEIVERHRLLIDRWFYPCSPAMQLGLAGLYENDPRFAANIDKYGDGLTGFLVEAIRENARRSK